MKENTRIENVSQYGLLEHKIKWLVEKSVLNTGNWNTKLDDRLKKVSQYGLLEHKIKWLVEKSVSIQVIGTRN
ncbi:hypothetical protein [Bacillus sp. ISL-45]|uniref:hypothetical protein n=1 Tax=Bacillus sp. ISL-45 TaxID=2819128 RepID=UPI001BE92E74|nr:hypothetical protein [Bacillus sp. ISL-45]MBT2660236.1 hypothetical protein [Bacillus sp. ISL-45]